MKIELDAEVIVPRVQGREDGCSRLAASSMSTAAGRRSRSPFACRAAVGGRATDGSKTSRSSGTANEAYEHYRAHGRDKQGRRLGRPPKPYEPPETPAGKINTTDLDSRNVKTPRSYTRATTLRPS